MTTTTTDAAEARARALEALARTYEEDNLHDTAWHVREGGLNGHEQRAVRAVMLATAEAASGAGERGQHFWLVQDEKGQVAAQEFWRDLGTFSPLASLPPATDPAMVNLPRKKLEHWQRVICGDWCKPGNHCSDCRDFAAALAAAPTIPATGEAGRKSMTAEWCLNMARLEEGQEVGAGMPDHPLRLKCELPPAGWLCTREPGHVGPCATIPATGHAATEGEGA